MESFSDLQHKLKTEVRRVVVVGNGGIAMETVHALCAHKYGAGSSDGKDITQAPIEVTWVMSDPYIGNTFLDATASAFLLGRSLPRSGNEGNDMTNVIPSMHMGAWMSGSAGGLLLLRVLRYVLGSDSLGLLSLFALAVFRGAYAFNGDVSAWDVSSLTNLEDSKCAREGTATVENCQHEAGKQAQENGDVCATPGSALGPEWSRTLRGEKSGKPISTNLCLQNLRPEFQCQCVAYKDAGGSWIPILNKEEHCAQKSEPEISHNQDYGGCNGGYDADTAWPLQVKLSNGRIYGCDLVISATGVIPNTNFMCQSETKKSPFLMHSDHSLEVNEMLQCVMTAAVSPKNGHDADCVPRHGTRNLDATQVVVSPDIFAAGDCCTIVSENISAHWFQMRLWSQARTMGMYAAHSAAGQLDELGSGFNFELFTHMSQFFGHKIVLLGQFNGQNLTHEQQQEIQTRVVTTQQICTKEDGFSLAQARSKETTVVFSKGENPRDSGAVTACTSKPISFESDVEIRVRVSDVPKKRKNTPTAKRSKGCGCRPRPEPSPDSTPQPEGEYVKVILKHGRVIGAMLIGETDLEETFENLILSQLDVSQIDLLNPALDLEDYFD
jgi:hypothetical protein